MVSLCNMVLGDGIDVILGVCGVWGCTGWLGSSLDFGFL